MVSARDQRLRMSIESLPHFQAPSPPRQRQTDRAHETNKRTNEEWGSHQDQFTGDSSKRNGQGKKKNKGKGKDREKEKENGNEWGHQDKPKEEQQQGGWKAVDGLDPNAQKTNGNNDTSVPSDSGASVVDSEWNDSNQADKNSTSGPSDAGASSTVDEWGQSSQTDNNSASSPWDSSLPADHEWDRAEHAHNNSPEPSVQQDTKDEGRPGGNKKRRQVRESSPERRAREPKGRQETQEKFNKDGW